MYAQMVKSTGERVKALDEMGPEERAFQERVDADIKIEPKDWMPEKYRQTVLRPDEILLEISTDKVDSEIPSPHAGKVAKLMVGEGDTVEVGSVIAQIETDSAETPADRGGDSKISHTDESSGRSP